MDVVTANERRPNPTEAMTRRDGVLGQARLTRTQTIIARLALLVGLLVLWEFVPQIPGVQKLSPVLDPFFVSSPTRVAQKLAALATGRGAPSIWPYLWITLSATALGFVAGVFLGSLAGLLLSHDRRIRQVLSPFINGVNSIPKVTIVPIIIIIFGSTTQASVIVSAMIVFFAVFFNAYAGGRGVPTEMLQNASLMGATGFGVMRHVRLMYVALWTFEALPNAISHGLLGVVTAEFLSGVGGIGRLIVLALVQVDSTLTFALVVMLSATGIILVETADRLRARVLHWWPGSTT